LLLSRGLPTEEENTNPLLLRSLLPLSELPQPVVALPLEVGLLLDLCLVEPVDDGVLALGDEDALDLLACEQLPKPTDRIISDMGDGVR